MNSIEEINQFNPDKFILVNDRVLLKIESVPNKIGAIIIPDDKLMKYQNSVVKGELISWSKDAFISFDEKPKKGDIVFFETYAGRLLYSKDEKERYRHMSIKDITGFERKE
jgi:co-chaperonin GroES (HSP10)